MVSRQHRRRPSSRFQHSPDLSQNLDPQGEKHNSLPPRPPPLPLTPFTQQLPPPFGPAPLPRRPRRVRKRRRRQAHLPERVHGEGVAGRRRRAGRRQGRVQPDRRDRAPAEGDAGAAQRARAQVRRGRRRRPFAAAGARRRLHQEAAARQRRQWPGPRAQPRGSGHEGRGGQGQDGRRLRFHRSPVVSLLRRPAMRGAAAGRGGRP